MTGDRPSISISELAKLQDQINRPTPLIQEEVHDYATAALVVLRGLSRTDKLKIIRRMRRQMD